jgi:hypothetical protein
MNEIELKLNESIESKENNGKIEYLYMEEDGSLSIRAGSNKEIYMMELLMNEGTPSKLKKYIHNMANGVKAETIIWAIKPKKLSYSKYALARFSDLPSVYGACYIIVSGDILIFELPKIKIDRW